MSDSPITLVTLHCNGQPVPMVNCSRYRVAGCEVRCIRFGKVTLERCAACGVRDPLVFAGKPGWRGLGDAVAAAVTWLTGGRADVAQKVAATVERKKGCGCKARREALNRALPFGKA